MKDENENETSPRTKTWTDEKIINKIIDLSEEAERYNKKFKGFMKEVAKIKAAIYSSNELIENRDLNYDDQVMPPDALIELVLVVRELYEVAEILRIKEKAVEKNIQYFRSIINA